MTGSALVIQGNARRLPLPDESVDLIVTSPPYFALRSYTDGGEHYDGQIGSEETWQEWIAALVECTAEWARVLKPSGSMFVDLGDTYAAKRSYQVVQTKAAAGKAGVTRGMDPGGIPVKSLMLLPERYRIAAVDQLGLIARAVICWAKPNGLPESVTDRVRRSHEDWVHLTKRPRYYSAVDEIRTEHARQWAAGNGGAKHDAARAAVTRESHVAESTPHPLGALPGSVWSIPTEPLTVPNHLGVDHFACVDEDTEILTTRGWLRHDDLHPGDTVAGYDLDAGLARWTACHAVHRYAYDGDLVAVEKRDLSMRLTPNHRTIAAKATGQHRRIGPLGIVDAGDLGPKHYIPRAAEWQAFGEKSIGESFAALLGWIAAEGWYTQSGLVALSQSLSVNPEHVATIDRIVADLPPFFADRTGLQKVRDAALDGSRYDRVRTYRGRDWTEVTWVLPLGASQEVRRLMPDKLLGWWALDLPEHERAALLDGFIDGDGHRRADGRVAIFQKYRANLDVLQAVAVSLGYRTSLREEDERHILYLNRGLRPLTLRGTGGAAEPIPREHYRGTVWCPTTGTGTFVARRRGSVFITGNSFPSEWPRRLILGWSPPGICVACGEGRRPMLGGHALDNSRPQARRAMELAREAGLTGEHLAALKAQGTTDVGRAAATQSGTGRNRAEVQRLAAEAKAALGGYTREFLLARGTITGYACACPTPDAPTRPAVVLDPFGGTGTTAAVARALGRIGISVDLSHDYGRVAGWRTTDPDLAAKVRSRTLADRQLTLNLSGGAA